ncbi:tripartite tricarboxylate transporter TctB family protein [Cryobacterium sp. TMT1-21]|uniref:Tripartite tricarboxylate transporter TctB family protein n=2 Tax=Microbacteriaceae TaxID=85023 RepID=A0AAQ2HFS3_9MICO|nr:tripartite tricarboxylate transporter TctB family protein [Cryobacterium shii]TFC83496.1 tripartite tricarboxylate transporter TctB family protein [Cryobacterium sp. TmT2-59]TFD16116.1 tripartite tricarboxylate transporter TctB family protein [Cryobacterium sp. TMT2-23]TFD16189.1 tripartite tricarboxylate transporter TctB family protein [Cryobacterium sp. TMT4-10]TFD18305.1 tripartite tricarboxylate transporter TctB family protein [Cryobacterium sp. TMT1-21]TFD37288.1 tripartite tricarboxyl
MRGRSELGVAALLGALAAVVAVDAANIRHTAVSTGVMGPQVVPFLIAAGLALCAIALTVNVLRGGHGHPEEGEDIDLTTGAHWPTLLGLGALILAAAFTMEPLGFVITSAILFYGSTLLLGSRHYVWGLLIGIALAVATFYGFVLGLGIPLPAGLLTGIL